MDIEINEELKKKLGELESYIFKFDLGSQFNVPEIRRSVQYNTRTKKTTVKLHLTWKSLTKKEEAALKKARDLRKKSTP